MDKCKVILMYTFMFIQLLMLISTSDMILKTFWICLFIITMSLKDAYVLSDDGSENGG